jgi:Domain of unknown function (DUF4062)
MKAFLSSTFWDLRAERRVAIKAIEDFGHETEAMETFVAKPTVPLKAVLESLRDCNFVVVIVGFKGGSLLPRRKGLTYTQAEYTLAKRLGLPVFAFIKTARGAWRNDERSRQRRKTLADFHARIIQNDLPRHFSAMKELRDQIEQALRKWDADGRPGARRVFSSPEQHFRSQMQSPLFDFEQSLRGRSQQLEELAAFLAAKEKTVALVKGRGGIGKSKLLRDWSLKVKGWNVLCVNEAANWSAETFKEIPDGKVLIIHDDAHRSRILDELLILTRDLKERGMVKLALSFRPTGSHLVQGTLARRFDQTLVSEIAPLEQLSRTDVRELAFEVLGPKFRQHAVMLAEVSRDTPLVTVVGGRLIARRQIPPILLADEYAFRRAVFDRFIDEQQGRAEDVGFDLKELLQLIAAIGPLAPRDKRFLDAAEKFLRLRADQIVRGADVLVAAGILLRGGTLVRIVPDVLSDFLLEQACVNDRGESNFFADAIYKHFGDRYLSNLLRNIGELDWRLARRKTSTSLMNQLWTKMEKRFRAGSAFERKTLLDAIQTCAMLQPAASIRLTHIAVQQPEKPSKTLFRDFKFDHKYVLASVAAVLSQIAYAPEYTDRAIRELWLLAKAEAKNGVAAKSLLNLSSYGRYKPVHYNERIAELLGLIIRESHAFDSLFTPLDIADKLLEKEGDFTEMEGITVRIGTFLLDHKAIATCREKAFAAVEFALMSGSARAATRAVHSLDSVISEHLPRMRSKLSRAEIRWQNAERKFAISMLARAVHRRTPLPAPVLRQIRHSLTWFADRTKNWLGTAARKIAEALNGDFVEIFDAFVSTEWGFDSINQKGEYVSGGDKRRDQLQRGAVLMENLYTTPAAKVVGIEQLYAWASETKIDLMEPLQFIELLCTRDPRLCDVLAKRILRGKPSRAFADCLRVVLRQFRSSPKYRKIAQAAAIHRDVNIVRAAAATLFRIDPDPVTDEELELFRLLSKHKDWWVRQNLLSGIRFLAKDARWRDRAIKLALSVRVSREEEKIADAFANIFGPYWLGKDALLRSTQVRAVLRKLLPIASLDGHHCVQLLAQWSETYPDEVLAFFRNRITRGIHQSTRRRSQAYAAVPHGLSLYPLSKSDHHRDNLKLLFDLFLKTEYDHYVAKLFWAVALFDDITIGVLDAILKSGESSKVKGVIDLLHYGPRDIAFNHPLFARRLLEAAEQNGPDVLSAATGRLVVNAMPSMITGGLTGEPPIFVRMRDKAQSLMQEHAADRLLQPVYVGIRQMALADIERMANTAADFNFQHS